MIPNSKLTQNLTWKITYRKRKTQKLELDVGLLSFGWPIREKRKDFSLL
jgi:hypothetical protein